MMPYLHTWVFDSKLCAKHSSNSFPTACIIIQIVFCGIFYISVPPNMGILMCNTLCNNMKLSPHWPAQHTELGSLQQGLNINLCHSCATSDSQTHSTVFCGEFGKILSSISTKKGFITAYLLDYNGQCLHGYKLIWQNVIKNRWFEKFYYFHICVWLCSVLWDRWLAVVKRHCCYSTLSLFIK